MQHAIAHDHAAPIVTPASGLAWHRDTLIAIDRTSGAVLANGRVLARLDAHGLASVASDGPRVVATSADAHGRVFAIDGAGNVREIIPMPAAHRHGCTVAADGTIYATQFQVSRFGAHDGAIVAIDPATRAVSMLLDGFHHPIGIVALADTLIVADARARAVYRVELVAGRAVARYQLAALPDRPAYACALGADAVAVTSYDPVAQRGTIRRIARDGAVTTIASGAWEPTGLAASPSRLYVARASGPVASLPVSSSAAS